MTKTNPEILSETMSEAISKTLINAILANRENRAKRQLQWLGEYSQPLISLSLNIPGTNKVIASAEIIYNKAIIAIKSTCQQQNWQIIKQQDFSQQTTGYEAMFAVDADVIELKQKMIALEQLPFGRILDLDVITNENGKIKIISRKDFGLPARKCYICDQPAIICARQQKHQLSELITQINKLALL